MSNEKYLDRLVTWYLTSSELKTGLDSPSEFLGLGAKLKLVYLGKTLQARLFEPISEITREGDLYVFAPAECFRYEISSKVRVPSTRLDRFNSHGSMDEGVEHIAKLAGSRKKEGQGTLVHTLFFNRESKREFQAKILDNGFQSFLTKPIEVEGYGTINFYGYVSLPKQPRQPDK